MNGGGAIQDDGARRGLFWLAVVPLGLMLAGAWVVRQRVLDEYRAFAAFCGATHPGEPWAHVQERAAQHEWGFVRYSPVGRAPEEWLSEFEQWGYRAGCVVTLDRGRVVKTRTADLPPR